MVLQKLDAVQPRARNVSALVRRGHRRDEAHIAPTNHRGPWVADSDCDNVGEHPLSEEARIIRRLGLIFPRFQAPGKDEIYALNREMQARSGSRYRAFGPNRVQAAFNELRDRGFWGWRKTTTGRPAKGTKPEWAYVSSFSRDPWDHLTDLKALTAKEMVAHYRARKAIWERYMNTGVLLDAEDNVIDLDEHRLGRVG